MARRKGGLFLPLDTEFMDEDKILDAGERAAWLYLAMMLRCKRLETDGVLTARQIERLGIPGWQKRLADLMRPLGADQDPLVTQLDADTYLICAWLNHNDPAELVQAKRRKDAERKRSNARNPDGIRTESERTPDVEERRGEEMPPNPPPSGGQVSRCTKHTRPKAYCEDCQLPPLIPVPRHCGDCSPSRRIEDETGADLGPCRTCHPSVVRIA